MQKVSIILPSYNHSSFLTKRLHSIVNQTYTNWELIIIDDKSTDNSVHILTDFVNENKSKIKHFIVNNTNSGSGYFSWQKGIELVETEYIWIAETDDYSELNFLEEQLRLLENNKDAVLSFCSSNYVDEEKNKIYDSTNRTKDLNVLENEFDIFKGNEYIDKLPFNTYITNGSSVVFRKPTLKIPSDIFIHKQCSDIFLWTFLLQDSSFIFLNKKLNYFRRHENSTTTKINSSSQLKNTYKEIIFYLNYFNIKSKNIEFINHYFNNYIWKNKSDIFNSSVFDKNKSLKFMYFKNLLKMVYKKIVNGR